MGGVDLGTTAARQSSVGKTLEMIAHAADAAIVKQFHSMISPEIGRILLFVLTH